MPIPGGPDKASAAGGPCSTPCCQQGQACRSSPPATRHHPRRQDAARICSSPHSFQPAVRPCQLKASAATEPNILCQHHVVVRSCCSRNTPFVIAVLAVFTPSSPFAACCISPSQSSPHTSEQLHPSSLPSLTSLQFASPPPRQCRRPLAHGHPVRGGRPVRGGHPVRGAPRGAAEGPSGL